MKLPLIGQEPEPDSSNLQPVRPQNRPDQPVGAWNEWEVFSGNTKPVLSREGLPAFAKMAGHTGYSHHVIKCKCGRLRISL